MRTLVFGYGNYDREDDGVAWHVMVTLKSLFTIDEIEMIDDVFLHTQDLEFVFQFQLTPEIAEEVARFDRVCFIDAHTGSVPEEIQMEPVTALYQNSPLTHHMTASSLLSIVQTLYYKVPDCVLVSIRGHQFGFTQTLSPATEVLVPRAASMIYNWIKKGE